MGQKLLRLMLVLAWGATASAQCHLTEAHSANGAGVMSLDWYGASVALHGDVALVGSPLDDGGLYTNRGSCYVFRFDGTDWDQEKKLRPSNGFDDDWFGLEVAYDGDKVLVGAPFKAGAFFSEGSAYVYHYDGTAWIEEAILTASDTTFLQEFGTGVSIDGDVLAVGARRDDELGLNAGAAYVFRYDGTAWTEEQKILASDGAGGDQFNKVALQGDTLAVGSWGDDNSGMLGVGAVYIYEYDGTSWVEQQKLIPSDPLGAMFFGISTSIDGDALLVGAYTDDDVAFSAGSGYIFRKQGTAWVEEQKLLSSDLGFSDNLGANVSLCGDVAVLSASYESEGGSDAGAAYVFRYDGTTWVEESKLVKANPSADDRFGTGVAVHGDRALVGAFMDHAVSADGGAAYAFDLLDDTNFDIIPSDVAMLDPVRLSTCGGPPGNPAALFLNAVNGSPFTSVILLGGFGSNGVWNLPGAIPNDSSLQGLQLTFSTLYVSAGGVIVATNTDDLCIQ
jgi:hypothetical protein